MELQLDKALSRRNVFRGGAVLAAGAALPTLAACEATTLTATVIDAIQAAVATACGFVPQAETLLQIVSEFPVIGGAATITNDVLQQVSTFLCSAYKTQEASGKASVKLKNGTTVVIHGLKPGPNGTFVQF